MPRGATCKVVVYPPPQADISTRNRRFSFLGKFWTGFGPVLNWFWSVLNRLWPGVEDICPEGRISVVALQNFGPPSGGAMARPRSEDAAFKKATAILTKVLAICSQGLGRSRKSLTFGV